MYVYEDVRFIHDFMQMMCTLFSSLYAHTTTHTHTKSSYLCFGAKQSAAET